MRFDLVHPPFDDLPVWRSAATDAYARGFTGLLCPEVPGAVDPVVALGAAAEAEPRLRVGTHVLAASLHDTEGLLGVAHELSRRAPGRVDLGLGTGRPQTRDGQAESGPALRRRLREAVSQVRQSLPDISVMVAAGGPRALGLAADIADEVILALAPTADEAAVQEAAATIMPSAAAPGPGLCVTLVAVGDVVAGHHARRLSAGDLRDQGAWATLPGDPAAAVETLETWHALGVVRVVVDPSLVEAVQPVIDTHRG